jgi:N-acyl homoserine lactone hydrolase
MPSVDVLHLADVVVEGQTWPVLAWSVAVPDGVVLVDTGMVETTPELEEEWGTQVRPWPELGEVVAVVNTHLHFDHCGGNRLFPGIPIYVQRAEYEAVSEPDYLVEWVHFPGARYELLDGEAEIMPGISVVPMAGHSPGHQVVLVDTDEGLVVLGGDVSHTLDGLKEERRVLDLDPHRIWITHSHEPLEP